MTTEKEKKPSVLASARGDELFGKIAVEEGYVSQKQLESCFEIQCNSTFPRHLGMIFLEKGLIKEEDLPVLLEKQQSALEKQLREQDREAQRKARQKLSKRKKSPDELLEYAEELRKKASGDPWIGQIIGGYLIISRIGYGGMGVVYKCQRIEDSEVFAFKMLSPQYSENPTYVQRFLREAKLASAIRHENVVFVTEVNQIDGVYYMVMELVDGLALDEIIYEEGLLPFETTLDYVIQMLEGIGEAHRKGIIHRDLKPENLLVTKDGILKVTDFGLAKLNTGFSNLTASGMVVGSPRFMSPEQCDGIDVDARSDIYSAGIILYYLLTGKYPFDGETPMEIMLKQQSEIPPSPRDYNLSVPKSVCRIVFKMLEKDRTARYATVDHVLRDVEKINVDNLEDEKDQFDTGARKKLKTGEVSDDIIRKGLQKQQEIKETQNKVVPLAEVLVREGLIDYDEIVDSAELRKFKLRCYECKEAVNLDEIIAMDRIRCPSCEKQLRVSGGVRMLKIGGRVALRVLEKAAASDAVRALIRQVLLSLSAIGGLDVVIDLEKVPNVNMDFVGVLIDCHSHILGSGGSLSVIVSSKKEAKKLDSCGLGQFVRIFQSQSDLLNAI
ncbi:MAG: protein kinase [Planctomycetes bacterium]|nr:protein kinase [Planctomycetota bacterium]